MVIFDDWIREEITTQFMEARLERAVLAIELDLQVFTDPNRANFRHSEVLHCVSNRHTLRIQNGGFRGHNYLHLHALNIDAQALPTS